MNIKLLKQLDAVVGYIAASVFPSPPRQPIPELRRILLLRPGGIGDAVLLVSVILYIRKRYPQSQITILAEKRNAAVFELCPSIIRLLYYDRPVEIFRVLRTQYDVVIDTEQWYRLSAVVTRLVRAPVKIGFATNNRRRMFTHGITYDQSAYEPDNFAALLKPLGADDRSDAGPVTLDIPYQAASRAGELLLPLGCDPFIVIFPSASVPEKCWGTEQFCQVAQKMVDNGYKIVVVGGPEDREDGEHIAGSEGLNLAGLTTLAETAAVVARSRLLISGDSGVLHIAAGLNISTVSLFGPSSVLKWAPRGDNHIVLSHHLACSPCSKFGTIPRCPIDSRCIKAITPDEVAGAAIKLLARLGTLPSQTCNQDGVEQL